MLEMLQWVMDKFMEIEVAHKTGAGKGVHSRKRAGAHSGRAGMLAERSLHPQDFKHEHA